MSASNTNARRGKRVENIARPKYITANRAKSQANMQNFLREFNPSYDQVLLRISDAPQGMKFGKPPGRVGT